MPSTQFITIAQFGTRCYQFWYAVVPYQYNVMSIFVLVGSLIQFWPYFAGYHDSILEVSILRNNLQSIENIVASTVLITLAVPLVIDGILDFMLSLLMDRNKAKETTDILNYIERTYIYSGFLIFPLCAFVRQQYSDLAMLALGCSRFQYCMVYGGMFMSASRIAPHCFSCRLCMLALGAYYSKFLIFTYSYLNIDNLSSVNLSHINTSCTALLYLAFSILVSMLMHWIWLNYLSICFSKQTSSLAIINHSVSSSTENIPYDTKLSLKDDIVAKNNMFVSVLSVIGVICTIILLSVSTSTFMNCTPTDLAYVHIAFSVFALGLLIYHLRKFRSDALLRLHALVNKKATLLKYVHELYEPISTIFESQKYMMEELGEEADETVMQSMSNTMDAVSMAVGKLHDLATQQYQDDGLPPAPNNIMSSIQRYSLAITSNYRDRHANPSSVHCSIDDNRSDHGEVDLSRGDGKTEENDGRGGYREGPSWGTHTPALVPALETIVERNDDDIESRLSGGISESAHYESTDGSWHLRSVFVHAREQFQDQLQQQQQQQQEQQRLQWLYEQQEEQQLQQAIQEELARAEGRSTHMSDVTAGTLRSERHQARSILNLRLCDTQYI